MNLQVSLDTLAAALFVFKTTGEIIYANISAETLIGYSLEELRERNICEIVALNLQAITPGYVTERKITTGKDESRWLRLEFDAGAANDEFCWVASVTDVTASRQVNRLEQEQRSLKVYSDELQALYRATSALFTSDDPVKMAQQIAQAVVRDFALADCGVMVVNHNSGQITRLARAGVYKVQASAPLDISAQGLVPEAVRTGEIVYVPDTTQDNRYVNNEPRTRSELVMPLTTVHGVIGVLDLQSTEVYAFSETDQRIIKTFAERASFALENILLTGQILNYTETLETRVAERTAELNDAIHRVEAILNNANDTILLAKVDGTMKRANPAFSRMFGYTPDEALQISISHLFEDQNQAIIQAAWSKVLRSGDTERIQLEAVRKDGSSFDVEIALSLINADQIQGVVCNIHDMTEHKQIESALIKNLSKERELNVLKSEFVTLVSHEFRTPLTTILSSSAMLEQYHDRLTSERRLHHLQKIQQQVNYLVHMMEDILHIGQVESEGLGFDPERIDLKHISTTIVEEIQSVHTASPQINLEIQGDCNNVIADTKLLRLILNNLLSNAIKYSPKESAVILRIMCSSTQVILEVEDHGIGMTEKDQDNLFKTFYRGKNVGNIPGTGLGLVIVKQAVEAYAGTISIESEVGTGTKFTIILPRKEISS